MQVQPYLNFDGRCEEALEFYRKAVGAEVTMMMRFKDCPVPQTGSCTPGSENKIMHASLQIGESTVLASDCHAEGKTGFQGFSLSIMPSTEAQAEKIFAALSEGGQVQMPLAKTFFAKSFGVLADRFGVSWMIVVMA